MVFSKDEITAKWHDLFDDKSILPDLLMMKVRYPEKRTVKIPFKIIERFSPEFAVELLNNPEEILNAGREYIVSTYFSDREVPANTVHIRIEELPDEYCINIRDVRAIHLNKFISIEGMVRKASDVRPKIVEAVFRCKSCNKYIVEPQDTLVIRLPSECYTDQGGCGKNQASTKFVLEDKLSRFLDFQRIEVEDTSDFSSRGTQLQHIIVNLEDDITGLVIPGIRVVVTGIVKSIEYEGKGKRSFFDIFIDAVSINTEKHEYADLEITPDEIETFKKIAMDDEISNKIVNSIAPSIGGMEIVKEAIALQLFGGVSKVLKDGIKIKGDIHILLLGDPGTAKSQLLRYVASLAPRGVYASGKSTTAAGLTAAAVRDDTLDGRWTLEAGMLVLANKGIACIDELDKMNEEDRSSMHEALEQQTISIAKAGITATLPAQCSVLAAANPTLGRFDQEQSVLEQTKLPTTLLTRFDVIFPLYDISNEEKDTRIARHILESHRAGEIDVYNENIAEEKMEDTLDTHQPVFPLEFLKKYISYARNNIYPVMEPDSMDYILNYYVSKRSRAKQGDHPIPITARQLEAYIRLSESSAKMRLSNKVTMSDVERAIKIVESFIQMTSTNENGEPDIDMFSSGISSKKRSGIKDMTAIIEALHTGLRKEASFEEIKEVAKSKGISEEEVERLLFAMSNSGVIYTTTINNKKIYNVVK
ncbi:MAG: minichromosome maintenance protein MCM [Candidatus Thermoplasmatota archaeon]|nr:minichromosome maintenance protein MCM [Candidatus Thermoplasmatota archaeon]MCL5963763.1 minichromosome maintenance protein MCM [Candidatus Thermoplasmatota archaeon]